MVMTPADSTRAGSGGNNRDIPYRRRALFISRRSGIGKQVGNRAARRGENAGTRRSPSAPAYAMSAPTVVGLEWVGYIAGLRFPRRPFFLCPGHRLPHLAAADINFSCMDLFVAAPRYSPAFTRFNRGGSPGWHRRSSERVDGPGPGNRCARPMDRSHACSQSLFSVPPDL